MTTKPAPSQNRPGAPLGNKNALKHGFYAGHFNRTEIKDLQKSDSASLHDEINMLRVYIRRIFEKANPEITTWEDIQILRTLVLATACLDRLIRTQHLIQPPPDPAQTLLDALAEATAEVTAGLNLDR